MWKRKRKWKFFDWYFYKSIKSHISPEEEAIGFNASEIRFVSLDGCLFVQCGRNRYLLTSMKSFEQSYGVIPIWDPFSPFNVYNLRTETK